MSEPAESGTDLSDRTILITGATGGLGSAVARAVAQRGATVVLSGRRVSELERRYDELAATGPQPAIAPLDLETAGWAEYAELAERLDAELGALHGLVHCAAAMPGLTPLANYPIEQWFRVMQTDLNAAFLLTRACLPLLRAAEDASVVLATDRRASAGGAYYGAYGVAKAGLESFAAMLASETEVNTALRVNCVDPGPLRTPLRQRIQVAVGEESPAEPSEVCGPFVYLLGPGSRGVTGQILTPADTPG